VTRRLNARELLAAATFSGDEALAGGELEKIFWAYKGLEADLASERRFFSSTNEALVAAYEELVAKKAELERARRIDRLRAGNAVHPGGESEAMTRVLALAEAVAGRDTTVLLQGETGSGKGVLARFIHERSNRAGRPFVELNCAGLQRELTESELFGHEKGAFTGAIGRKLGLFEAADGGTLFLDEIGEMDAGVQAKLLKVLESRRFRRLGGMTEVRSDVRVIAATHRQLETQVAEGHFRSDLLYRLNVFAIELPTLRERRSDILPLATKALAEHGGRAGFSPEAQRLLSAYDWPGNVRELRNVIERAAILCPADQPVQVQHLPPLRARPPPAMSGPDGTSVGARLDDAERRSIENALRAANGTILEAARALGIARGTLYRKIRKYGLVVDDPKE
jgi:DNA-binding NtrC family response regulator